MPSYARVSQVKQVKVILGHVRLGYVRFGQVRIVEAKVCSLRSV